MFMGTPRRPECEEFFGAAIKTTQMSMVITDPHQVDNPIVFVNDAFLQLTGYTREEVIGRNCRFLQGPETDRDAVARIRVALQNETEIQVVLLNYRKDGSTFWTTLYLSPARDDDGKLRFFFASQIDVSDRIEAQRLIAEQKATLEVECANHTIALQQLETAKSVAEHAVRQKSEFVANMSHELRTPLTGILGLHDLLQADPTLGPKQRRYLIMARDAGRSLLTVVNDVLDFSKIDAGELAIEKLPFGLLSLVESCEDLTAEAARTKSLRLEICASAAPLMLLGDAARLKQILMNLISNAIKFTDAGSVTVTSTYDAEQGRLRFEVADTGIGIAEDKLPSMFSRFTQADTSTTRRFGGTGLGLAICKRLTELMDGQIGVTSSLGRGSTFWFEIPAREAGEEASDEDFGSLSLIPPRRVLLAEDNIVNQEIIKSMLETRGHAVTLVDNGAAAAAAACTLPAFDLILMDLQMPIMDGLSAARAIRSAEASDGRDPTPIIGLTANAMMEDVERCLDAGMESHVAKPIEWGTLFAAMAHAYRRSPQPHQH